jgi:hypothetical protein
MAEPWPIGSWPCESLTESAIARAACAKAHEMEAHRRAIRIHEDAALLFERLCRTGKSADVESVQDTPGTCFGWP